jgi:hypothetical protein
LVPFGQGSEHERRDAPDLVLILDDEMVVCEAKFFGGCSLRELDSQLRSQRRQIRHISAERVRPEIRAYRQVAILPIEFSEPPDCDSVMTWQDVADLAAKVMGRSHYVAERLHAAVRHFKRLLDKSREKNYNGIDPLDSVLERCRLLGDAITVGHEGGENDLTTRSLTYLSAKQWKWREPAMNKGRVKPKNWIPGTRFAELIESKAERASRYAEG